MSQPKQDSPSFAEEKVNVYRGPYHWYLPAFFDFLHRAQLEPVFENLPPSARILDIGAGDGRLTHLLAERFRFVVGLEPQARALALARLMTEINGTSPALLQADAADLPLRPASFDCVTAFDVIEHLPRPTMERLLREMRRVLVPRGWAVVTTPNRESLRNRVLGHRLDPKHYFELDKHELAAEISKAGFEIVRLEGLYVTPPVPRIEHFASVFPFRALFRGLGRLGRRLPELSERLVAIARALPEDCA